MQFNAEVKRLSRNFSANMNVIRVNNELSLRGLARETGISATTARRIENARKTRFGRGNMGYVPTLSTVVKVAQSLGTSPNDLLLGRL